MEDNEQPSPLACCFTLDYQLRFGHGAVDDEVVTLQKVEGRYRIPLPRDQEHVPALGYSLAVTNITPVYEPMRTSATPVTERLIVQLRDVHMLILTADQVRKLAEDGWRATEESEPPQVQESSRQP